MHRVGSILALIWRQNTFAVNDNINTNQLSCTYTYQYLQMIIKSLIILSFEDKARFKSSKGVSYLKNDIDLSFLSFHHSFHVEREKQESYMYEANAIPIYCYTRTLLTDFQNYFQCHLT